MVRVNFEIPEELKEQWVKNADSLNVSLTQFIKDAVEQYQKHNDSGTTPSVKKIERFFEEKMMRIEDMMLQLVDSHQDIAIKHVRIKKAIIKLLEKSAALSLEELEKLLVHDSQTIQRCLNEMEEQKTVSCIENLWSLNKI